MTALGRPALRTADLFRPKPNACLKSARRTPTARNACNLFAADTANVAADPGYPGGATLLTLFRTDQRNGSLSGH